jgi:uncharacterized protein YndB with AHSA1/START domain
VANELVVRRALPYQPTAVFAAWTDPVRLARWMSPFGRAEVEADLRVGGRFRIVMHGPDRAIEHTGEYREVDPPRRLVFTWCSPYTGSEASVVTVELRQVDDGTELTLTHAQLPADQVESHGGGWGSILDQLARHLAEQE